jgi:hypothetical protein
MPAHIHATHTIVVEAPLAQAFMFFTPAGEELWVDGWRPAYLHPHDGRTEAGMVFTTGSGSDFTIWTLVDFDREQHRSRYLRCTPGSRTGIVEVRCRALDAQRTEAAVSYTLTALSVEGERVLEGFEGEAFAEMIDGWAREIDRHLGTLLKACIR